MSITPEWAPNIHPMIVHFPIALLIIAVLVDLLSIMMKKQRWFRHAATLLYSVGAVSAIVTYLTGRNAADTVMLPAAASPVVNEHSDWAFRTVWFFGILASVRLSLSFIIEEQKYAVTLPLFVAGLAGIFLLYETAEHGGQLVFQYGVGVRAVSTKDESIRVPADETVEPGIIESGDGSWKWQPGKGALNILHEQFNWLEGSSPHAAPELFSDPEKGRVLALHPTGKRVMFTFGADHKNTQADMTINISGFTGSFMLAHHVQDAENFDFLALDNGITKLGRMEQGKVKVLDHKAAGTYSGWIELTVSGGGGHYKGYMNGTLLTHGHTGDLPPGNFGLRIDGRGIILVEQISVKSVQ